MKTPGTGIGKLSLVSHVAQQRTSMCLQAAVPKPWANNISLTSRVTVSGFLSHMWNGISMNC